MKFLKQKLVFSIIPILVFVFSSCTKNVPGPKGDPGEPGKNGNVNQFHTSAFTQPAGSWTFFGNWWTSVIYVPEITNDVKSKGEVITYMQIGTQWWSLPFAVGDIFMQTSIEEGKIFLKYSEIHDGPPPKPEAINFRVVVLTPVQ